MPYDRPTVGLFMFLTLLMTPLGGGTTSGPPWSPLPTNVYFLESTHYIILERDFTDIQTHLDQANKQLKHIKSARKVNPWGKGLNNLLQSCIKTGTWKLTNLMTHHDNLASIRQERGIDFLGELWSSISGNPSPSQWRTEKQILDQIKAKLNASDTEFVTVAKALRTNAEAIRTMQQKQHHDISSLAIENSLLGSRVEDGFTLMSACNSFHNDLDVLTEEIRQMTSIANSQQTGILSPEMISPKTLADTIRTMETRRGYQPAFDEHSSHLLYKERLSSTTLTKEAFTTVVGVPLINTQKPLSPSPCPNHESLMLLKDPESRYHCYLTNSAYNRCHPLASLKMTICNNRPIEQYGRPSNTTIYEESPNKFHVTDAKGQIFISCPNGSSEHTLNHTMDITLPNNCSLNGPSIFIKKSNKVEHTSSLKIETHPNPLPKASDIYHLLQNLSQTNGIGNPLRKFIGNNGSSTNASNSNSSDIYNEAMEYYQSTIDNNLATLDHLHKQQAVHTSIISDLTSSAGWHPFSLGVLGITLSVMGVATVLISIVLILVCRKKQLQVNFPSIGSAELEDSNGGRKRKRMRTRRTPKKEGEEEDQEEDVGEDSDDVRS